ncbi:hypothetical protein FACS1894172_16600 [Spirochaetia bacterium]|nr:hypothetical protein FACS1894164_00820 [Spirochaetia bacterium]GHU35191.1 hypothetical protein FACS1894172_16600 [Spirochaetia bacterium]
MNLLFFILVAPLLGAQTRPDAMNEYRNGNFERSIAICADELLLSPNNIEAHIVMCWSLIGLSRYTDASVYARSARSINRYDSRVAEIQGEIAYYEGRNNESLRFFQEYVNLTPEGSRIDSVYYFMGEIYIRQGRFHHADISFSLAVRLQPRNPLWWSRLAYSREKVGDFIEAIRAYQESLALNPQLSDARRGLERTRQALASR